MLINKFRVSILLKNKINLIIANIFFETFNILMMIN